MQRSCKELYKAEILSAEGGRNEEVIHGRTNQIDYWVTFLIRDGGGLSDRLPK